DAVEFRGAVIAPFVWTLTCGLAKVAAARESVAHQIFAWGAGQHSAVRAYQCHQIIVEVDNRSVIPDEVGEPCGYKDKAGRPFLCRTLIESNNAELRGLSRGAPGRPSNVYRFLP